MALIGGVALPAGQLAMVANVAPQTASSHLSRLVQGELLAVEQQGRHRYYRIATGEVANAVEALLAITPRARVGLRFSEAETRRARFARRCLDWTERRHHIGGQLGCAMLSRFRELKWIATVRDSRTVRVTHEGERQLAKRVE